MYSNPPNYYWDEDAKKARYDEISKSLLKQFKELTKGRKPTNDETKMWLEANQRAYDTVYSPTPEQRWMEYAANANKIQDDFMKSWKGKQPTGKMFDDFNAELTAAYLGAMLDQPRPPPGEPPQLPPPPPDLADDKIPLPPPLEKHPEYGLHLPSEPYPYDKGSLNRGKLYDPKIGLPSRNEQNPIIMAPSGAEMAISSRPSPEDLNSAYQGVRNVFNAVYQTGVPLSDEQIQSAVGEVFGLWSKHKITPPCPMLALINIFRTINAVGSNLDKFGNATPMLKQHFDNASNAILSGDRDALLNIYSSLGAYSISYMANSQIVVDNMGKYIVDGTNFLNATISNGSQTIAKLTLEKKAIQEELNDTKEEKRKLAYELEQHKSEKKQIREEFNKQMEELNRKLNDKDQILSAAEHEAYEQGQKSIRNEYALKSKAIEEEHAKTLKYLGNCEERIEELETQRDAIAANIKGVENFNGTLAEAVSIVVKKGERAALEVETAKGIIRNLQNQLEDQREKQKEEVANYEETIERMKAEHAEEIGKYEETLNEWDNYYDEKEEEVKLYKRSIEEREQTISNNLKEIGRLRYEEAHGESKSNEEKEALRKEIQRLRDENSSISGTISETKKDFKILQNELDNAKTKISTLRNELQSKQTAQEIMEEKYKKVLKELETSNSTIQNLNNGIQLRDRTIVNLRQQNSSMVSQFTDYNEIVRQKEIADAQAKSEHALVERLQKELDEQKRLKTSYIPPSFIDDVVVDPNLDAAAGLLEQAGAEIPPIPFANQVSILNESIELSGIKQQDNSISAKRKRGPPPPSTFVSTSASKRMRAVKTKTRTSSSRERNKTRGGYVVGGRPDPIISPYGKSFWQKMYLSNYHLF